MPPAQLQFLPCSAHQFHFCPSPNKQRQYLFSPENVYAELHSGLRVGSPKILSSHKIVLSTLLLLPTKSCAFFPSHILIRKVIKMNAQHYYRNISLDLDFASWATCARGLSKISGVAFARFLGCCASFLCKAVLTICGAIQTLTKALRHITDERLEGFLTFQHIKSVGN